MDESSPKLVATWSGSGCIACLPVEPRLACALACLEGNADGEPQQPSARVRRGAQFACEALCVGLMQASFVVFAGQLGQRIEAVRFHRSPLSGRMELIRLL